MRQLVFVHGRSQHHKDSVALKREWVDALRVGMDKAGLDLPIDEDDIRFPYYGDTLEQIRRGATEEEAADVIVRGEGMDRQERAFVRSVMEEVRQQAGISDDELRAESIDSVVERGLINWEWIHLLLKILDRTPGGSGAAVALATRDVYQYLRNPGIRDVIDAGVMSAFTPGVPTVVVGHSLGAVVSYNVLRREGDANDWDIPLYVTVGAPLGITAIRNGLSPIRHPRCVEHWFNAMDERDIVALYPLDSRRFDVNPAIENKTHVDNDTPSRHGISGYVSDTDVARRIHEALLGRVQNDEARC